MNDTATLRDAPWLTSGAAARVLALLDRDGEEARIVGGAVRNALLGVAIGDIDIATTALPAEVVRRADADGIKHVPTGIAHGTVTLVVDGRPFEVTTLLAGTATRPDPLAIAQRRRAAELELKAAVLDARAGRRLGLAA